MSISRLRPCRRIGFLTFFFVCSLSPLHAQLAADVSIVYSSGGDFSLTRAGDRDSYSPSYIYRNPVPLQNFDYIQTGQGVFVKALFSEISASVDIAENTSVIFETIGDSSGISVISLVYGRVRVNRKGDSGKILVNAGASVTEIQNGSVNLDLVTTPGSVDSGLVLYVSTLSGSAAVIPSAVSPDIARIRMKPHETVIFNARNNNIDRQSMNNEIDQYWAATMSGKAMNTGETEFEPSGVVNAVSKFRNPDPDYAGKAAFLKTRFIIYGMVMLLSGAALQNIVHYTYDSWDSTTADLTFYAGYVPLGLGAFILLAAYFY
ncbi:MAG: hypothetical protein LBH50_00265 [Spirochaetaceae bacterium]|jgi:hypothetical protein|nr:hypothetical protein [Spirochaetaceae bacterium]